MPPHKWLSVPTASCCAKNPDALGTGAAHTARRVTGLFVEGKSGRVAVKAQVVVDATSDADLARRAGPAVA